MFTKFEYMRKKKQKQNKIQTSSGHKPSHTHTHARFAFVFVDFFLTHSHVCLSFILSSRLVSHTHTLPYLACSTSCVVAFGNGFVDKIHHRLPFHIQLFSSYRVVNTLTHSPSLDFQILFIFSFRKKKEKKKSQNFVSMKSKLNRSFEQHHPETIRNRYRIVNYHQNRIKLNELRAKIKTKYIRSTWATIAVYYYFFFFFNLGFFIRCKIVSGCERRYASNAYTQKQTAKRKANEYTESKIARAEKKKKTAVENSYDKSARFHHE